MTRTLPTWSALVVLIVSLVVAGPASARPDGRSQLPLVWPADGTVTSSFGAWRGDRRHEGIDIGILRSLRLRAVANGVVRATGYAGGYEGYGMVVLLDLPGPYSALYAHLSDVDVRVGERVRAGERIGLAGCTGSCTGTHLHFELTRGGVQLDPLSFLP